MASEGTAYGISARVLAATWLGALTLVGCPVDDRDLGGHGGAAGNGRGQSGSGNGGGDSGSGGVLPDGGFGAEAGEHGGQGGGGSSGGPGTGGTTCPPQPAGGRSGASGSTQDPCTCGGNGAAAGAEPCPDLDGNDVPDCDETAIQNATFDVDTRFWSEELGLTLTWSESDAHARADSGALVVENTYEAELEGQFLTGARQCLDVTKPAIYRAAAEILVPEHQDEGTGGIQLIFYDQVGCSGQVVLSGISNAVASGDVWKVITVTRASPPTAKSLAFRLIAIKPYSQESFKVLFDNVLVRTD